MEEITDNEFEKLLQEAVEEMSKNIVVESESTVENIVNTYSSSEMAKDRK